MKYFILVIWFVILVVGYTLFITKPSQKQLLKSTNSTSSSVNEDQDVLRNYILNINDKKIDEAILLMKIQNEIEKPMWINQFKAIDSIKLISMDINEADKTDVLHTYKVVLDVHMNPNSINAEVPYYGWLNGHNTRWISLEKSYGTWFVTQINTGL